MPEENTTNILIIQCFKLIDPEKGLKPENRQILLQTNHSIRKDYEIQQMDLQKCEPWIPLSLFKENETFYEIQYRTQQWQEENSVESGVPKWLFKNNYDDMTPEQILNMNLSDTYEVIKNKQNDQNEEFIEDQDYKYFSFIGEEYITMEQRIEHEKQDPYVYIHFEYKKVNGCEHYWRKAFPICYDCKKLQLCRFCHEIDQLDHKMDRRKTKLMYCLYCGKVGKIGMYCIHCHKQISKIFCNICKTLCNIDVDVKPAYHCDKCGCCRVGYEENSCHCDKCNNCYDKSQKEDKKHKCQEQGFCMICQEDLSEAIEPEYQLNCSPQHRIHVSCYEQMLRNGQIFCPLCHKIIITKDQYIQIKSRVYNLYKNQKFQQQIEYPLVVYKCYDCEEISCDLYSEEFQQYVMICHKCFGINCTYVTDKGDNIIHLINAKRLQQKIKNCDSILQLTSNDVMNKEKCIQHVLQWRTLHEQLCPVITSQIQNIDSLLKNYIVFNNQDGDQLEFLNQMLEYMKEYMDGNENQFLQESDQDNSYQLESYESSSDTSQY